MGLRVRKSFKIAPGVRVNLSKTGAGLSFGVKGFRYSVHSSGRTTTTLGIPGTGISYISTSGGGRSKTKSHTTYSSSKSYAAQMQREKERAQCEKEKARLEKEKEKQKKLEMESAKAAVEKYESYIAAIKTIHTKTIPPIQWDSIYQLPEPYPNPYETPGPKETDALQKYNNYKPGFFAKHFKFAEDSNQSHYQQLIEKGRKEDREVYGKWFNSHMLAEGILNGDCDAMLDAVDELHIFDSLVEFGSGFEIGFLDEKTAEIEFSIKADTVVPIEIKQLTPAGNLSVQNLSKSARLDIMQDYVCSCIIRIAGDIFNLLPIEGIYVHAIDTFIDTAVGYPEEETIISVYIDRSTYSTLNLKLIDPSDAMANFKCNMEFLKTKGFKPIDRLQ